MRIPRIYYPFSEKLGGSLKIEGDKAHYVRNVLRLKIGRQIRLFNHNKQEYFAEITSLNKKYCEIKLCKSIVAIPASKLEITLIQSLSKGDRMDYSIQKATELGVSKIQPIHSEFSEVSLSGKRLEKKINHWKNVIISACEQSFRVDIPIIMLPISLKEYSNNPRIGLYLEPNETRSIQQITSKKLQQFDIAIGPEGGWSQTDISLLKSSGLLGIKFGSRILRTETMAPAILASVHSLWGDFV